MRLLFLTFLIWVAHNVAAQVSSTHSIKLVVQNDSLILPADSLNVHISFTVTNGSGKNLIFYQMIVGVRNAPFTTMDVFCDPERPGANLLFFVFEENLKPKAPLHWFSGGYNKPMTRDRLDSVFARSRVAFLENTVVLKNRERRDFKAKLNTKEFHLQPGKYYVQLIYYSGKRIFNSITPEQAQNDQRINSAEIFFGCLLSEKIPLIVK